MNQTHPLTIDRRASRKASPARMRGFSLVELMIALGLGLLLTYAMINVYLSSKTAFRRQDQLATVQQSVRTAFEYLTSDVRMVGHMGCFTGRADGGWSSNLSASDVRTNYSIGIEGFDYAMTGTPIGYTLTGNSPTNVTTASLWTNNNAAAGGLTAIPVTTFSGSSTGDGLTPGSDVLVVRSVSGKPVRLSAAVAPGATSMTLEFIDKTSCTTGAAVGSGFCAASHGLISSCTTAKVFSLSAATAAAPSTTTVTLASGTNVGAEAFPLNGTEVFPLQTVAYYVKKSSSGTSTSLYRRTFDGNDANGVEQELIEGVESMQLTYGVDTSTPPNGVIDNYVTADGVTSWNTVVAVRMALLMRAADPVEAGTTVPATGLVNGVTITYPTTGSQYDRRVFTTTVAVRNKIAYF